VKRPVWSAGDSVLVFTGDMIDGDMIDKGPRGVAVLRLIAALGREAREQGGEVIALAGNHEAEFLESVDERKHAGFIADLKSAGAAAGDVASCRGDIGEFLCGLPYAARVGDWFFSHAGNSGGRGIEELSRAIRLGGYSLTASDSMLEARLGNGAAWFASPGSGMSERQLIASYARALGVKHLVQGHQHNEVIFEDGVVRRKGEMFQRWGLLFLIDVGMSREVNDSLGAVLKIEPDQAFAICPAGARTLLWSRASDRSYGGAICR
jgi:hypothetical protein